MLFWHYCIRCFFLILKKLKAEDLDIGNQWYKPSVHVCSFCSRVIFLP